MKILNALIFKEVSKKNIICQIFFARLCDNHVITHVKCSNCDFR